MDWCGFVDVGLDVRFILRYGFGVVFFVHFKLWMLFGFGTLWTANLRCDVLRFWWLWFVRLVGLTFALLGLDVE